MISKLIAALIFFSMGYGLSASDASDDEPDQLSWEFFGKNRLAFAHFKEWAAGNPPPETAKRVMPEKFPLVWLKAGAMKASGNGWEHCRIYESGRNFVISKENADMSDMTEGQKKYHIEKLASGEVVLKGPEGHNWAANTMDVEIPQDGEYRIWVKYFHNNAQARGFTVSVLDKDGLSGYSHSFDRNPFAAGFDRKPKIDKPDGFLWEDFLTPVFMKKGTYTLKIAGDICNGFAPTLISAIVFAADPCYIPDTPPSKAALFTGEVPVSDNTKKDWALMCVRPGMIPFESAAPELQKYWLSWRHAFIDRLANYRGRDYDWSYLASMAYFDEDHNLIARPSQIASQTKCDDTPTFICSLTGKDFKLSDSSDSKWTVSRMKLNWQLKSMTDAISPAGEKSEASTELDIPRKGKYYIWLQYAYEPESEIKISIRAQDGKSVLEKKLNTAGNGSAKTDFMWTDFVSELSAGKHKITLLGKKSRKMQKASSIASMVVTSRTDFTPEKRFDISDGKKIGTGSTACWVVPDPWGGLGRFLPPGQLVADRWTYRFEPLDESALNPAEVKIEARCGEVITQLVMLRNNQDASLKITPLLTGKLPAKTRVVASTLTGTGSWSPMLLLNRRIITAPAHQNTGFWLTFDCRRIKTPGSYPMLLTLGEHKIKFEITLKGSIIEAPVPIVGGWANPYPRISAWEAFADIGINLLYGAMITKEQMNKYNIKHIAGVKRPNDNDFTPEAVRKCIDDIKKLGLDYGDWSWYLYDEPGEKVIPKWLEMAKTIKSTDSNAMIWCNMGEPNSSMFSLIMSIMPYWDVSCPYVDHFKVAEKAEYADYKKALAETGKLKLLYTTPCMWWNEKRPDAPHDMLDLGEYALKYNRDGWSFFNLIYGDIWNDPYGGNQDGGVAIYPASYNRIISTRYMEAIREAIQRWKAAKTEAENNK